MIHHTADIQDGAKISNSAQIGAFCSIGSGVVVDDSVILEPHVKLESGVTIGPNTHIYPYAHIGGRNNAINIGESCNIREFSRIGSNTSNKSLIAIGSECYIMAYVSIRPNVTVEKNCIITNNVTLNEGCICQTKSIIGAKATIAKNCTIGRGSMIGGVSVVVHDIPPFCLVEGCPKAKIRGLNLVGMRRGFEDRDSIASVKRAFALLKKVDFDYLFAKNMLIDIEDRYARQFVEFVSTHQINLN